MTLVVLFNQYLCPVGWDCRIHRLHFCRGVRHPQWVSWIWHKTIWSWGSSDAEALGDAGHPFIAIPPKSNLARDGGTWYGPIYRLNRTNCILMLNWIVWNRTVCLNWIALNWNDFDNLTLFTFKLHAYAKLKWNSFWHWNCTYTKLTCLV